MSDLKYHDAAIVWVDNKELHGSFHHTPVAREGFLWMKLHNMNVRRVGSRFEVTPPRAAESLPGN